MGRLYRKKKRLFGEKGELKEKPGYVCPGREVNAKNKSNVIAYVDNK